MKYYLLGLVIFLCSNFTCYGQSLGLKKNLTINPREAGYFFDLAVDQKGDIFASDVFAHNIKCYSPKGNLQKQIGRKGKGPGEFLVPKNLAVHNSSLYVYDDHLLRITIFNLKKRVKLRKTIKLLSNSKSEYLNPDRILFEPPKLFYAISAKPYSKNNLEKKHSAILNEINSEGEITEDSILTVPAKQYLITHHGSNFTVGPMPFGRKPVFVAGKNGTFYYGNTNKLDIKKYSNEGKILQRYAAKTKKIRVTEKDFKNEAKRVHDDPEEIRHIKPRNKAKTFPAFNWFVVDNRGYVWVAVNTESRNHYSLDIFKNNGKLIGKIPLSKSVELKVIKGGYAYGIKTGKKGVQSIVRYKIKGLK